jgi:uncharacterized protein (DUF952 family)
MIYHLTSSHAWETALVEGTYLPEQFAQDGFIHCSKKGQVIGVTLRYYANASDLFLLEIDPDKLESRVIFENLAGGEELFPHIYGPLNLKAVTATAIMPKDAEAKFHFPVVWTAH